MNSFKEEIETIKDELNKAVEDLDDQYHANWHAVRQAFDLMLANDSNEISTIRNEKLF